MLLIEAFKFSKSLLLCKSWGWNNICRDFFWCVIIIFFSFSFAMFVSYCLIDFFLNFIFIYFFLTYYFIVKGVCSSQNMVISVLKFGWCLNVFLEIFFFWFIKILVESRSVLLHSKILDDLSGCFVLFFLDFLELFGT